MPVQLLRNEDPELVDYLITVFEPRPHREMTILFTWMGEFVLPRAGQSHSKTYLHYESRARVALSRKGNILLTPSAMGRPWGL